MEMNHYNLQQQPTPELSNPSTSVVEHIYPLLQHQGNSPQNGGLNHHHYLPHMLPQPPYTLLPPPTQPPPSYDEDRGWKKLVMSSAPGPLPPIKVEPSEIPTPGVSLTSHQSFIHDEDAESLESTAPSTTTSSVSNQTFVACRVCGDKASGYHYGVTSCEGCKGFFRRSMQKQIEYRCLREGKCQVMRLNRNRCQYCRFKKCVAVGMSRDSVRYGRVPKRSMSTEDQSINSSPFNALSQELTNHSFQGQVNHFSGHQSEEEAGIDAETKSMMLIDIVLAVSHAHVAYCDETEDKMAVVERRQGSLLNHQSKPDNQITNSNSSEAFGIESSNSNNGNNNNIARLLGGSVDVIRCQMFQGISQLVTPSINKVVEFAKRIPDFQNLTQDDQLTLIKTGFFELCLVRSCRLYNDVDGTVLFCDGTCIHRRELDVVYGVELIDSLFEFASQLTYLGLNDTEIGLFACIALIAPERQGILDYTSVQLLRDRVTEAFALQVQRNHPVYPSLSTGATTSLLPSLRIIGVTHDRLLDYYRARWRCMNLPPLFAEIYDFPRPEEPEEDRSNSSGSSGCYPPTTVANNSSSNGNNCNKEMAMSGSSSSRSRSSGNNEVATLKIENLNDYAACSGLADCGISSGGLITASSSSTGNVKVEATEHATKGTTS